MAPVKEVSKEEAGTRWADTDTLTGRQPPGLNNYLTFGLLGKRKPIIRRLYNSTIPSLHTFLENRWASKIL